jgi:hypothetical protein
MYDRRLREVKLKVVERLQVLGLCYLDHHWRLDEQPAEEMR